jgi:hypothetical protein
MRCSNHLTARARSDPSAQRIGFIITNSLRQVLAPRGKGIESG